MSVKTHLANSLISLGRTSLYEQSLQPCHGSVFIRSLGSKSWLPNWGATSPEELKATSPAPVFTEAGDGAVYKSYLTASELKNQSCRMLCDTKQISTNKNTTSLCLTSKICNISQFVVYVELLESFWWTVMEELSHFTKLHSTAASFYLN